MIATPLQIAVCGALIIILKVSAGTPLLAQASVPAEEIVPIPGDPRPINATDALPEIGEMLPTFKASLLSGEEVSDGSLIGQPAVIAVWSTDCPGSRAALQEMEALFEEFSPLRVRFVILATDEDNAVLKAFADSARIQSPIAQVGDETLRPFIRSRRVAPSELFQVVFAKPSFLVVDRQGRIVARSGGVILGDRLRGALRDLTDQI